METLVARKAVFDQVGGFDETLRTSEDVDWYARASDAGVPMTYLDKVLLHKRIHDQNSSLDIVENTRSLLSAIRKSALRKRTQHARP